MAALFVMTLPGLLVALFFFAVIDQVLLRVRGRGLVPWRRETQVSSTGFDLLHAALSPGKQDELDQRRTELLLRDEEAAGAPPRDAVDLDSGVVHVRLRQPRVDSPAPDAPSERCVGVQTISSLVLYPIEELSRDMGDETAAGHPRRTSLAGNVGAPTRSTRRSPRRWPGAG